MSFRHEDVAVGRDQDVVRLVEVAWRGGSARSTERHQEFSVRAEFEYLVSLRRTGGRTGKGIGRDARCPWRIVLTIGHPDVALAIDVDSVREDEDPGTEAPLEHAGRVELQE